MKTRRASIESIEKFLAQKRIAMIGISRDPKSFSMSLFDELCRCGYDVVPVNPSIPNIKGQRCFARVQEVQPPVTAALLMTKPQVTEKVVSDCADAGIRQIWMYRAGGAGAVSAKAVAFCEAKGMDVIPGECPFMFLAGASGVHRFHGFFRKITGRFPRPRAAA
jgi:uncharacterized protein